MTTRLLLFLSLLGCGSDHDAPEPSPQEPVAESASDESAGAASDGESESPTPTEAAVTAPVYEPAAGSLRLVVVAPEAGLLGSEQRAVDGIRSDLDSSERTVDAEPPSSDEVSAVESLLRGEEPVRPVEWAQAETVVAMAFAEPHVPQGSDARHSLGPRGFAILRGESMTPKYLSRIEARYSTYGYNPGYARAESRAFIENFLRILEREADQ